MIGRFGRNLHSVETDGEGEEEYMDCKLGQPNGALWKRKITFVKWKRKTGWGRDPRPGSGSQSKSLKIQVLRLFFSSP